jgi:hypothetical protein
MTLHPEDVKEDLRARIFGGVRLQADPRGDGMGTQLLRKRVAGFSSPW